MILPEKFKHVQIINVDEQTVIKLIFCHLSIVFNQDHSEIIFNILSQTSKPIYLSVGQYHAYMYFTDEEEYAMALLLQ